MWTNRRILGVYKCGRGSRMEDRIGSCWDVDSSGSLLPFLAPCTSHSLLVMHSIPKDEWKRIEEMVMED